jgi:alpha-tubulin suppressor-like RCC1 family protein
VLGDGTRAGRSDGGGRVQGLTDAVDLAVGGETLTAHGCAVRRSGAVVCWGYNASGQLGNGTLRILSAGPEVSPVTVELLGDAVRIGAGATHTCAVRRSGLVVCWGNNEFGHLGDGALGTRPFPSAVTAILDAEVVTAGRAHSCARRLGGAVACWGDNRLGTIGDGTVATFRLAPVAPVGLLGVVALAAGDTHTCAISTGGHLRCWGDNGRGQLGDGTFIVRALPTTVAGL